MPKQILIHWFPLLMTVIVCLTWETVAHSPWASIFFPPPTRILVSFFKMLADASFWYSLGHTLFRLIIGLLIGCFIGLALGWGMGSIRSMRVALEPFVSVLHPMPKVALLPLFIVVLGISETSKVAICALTAFFPILINTLAGVMQIDRSYWEIAKNYEVRGWKLLLRVIIPGSLPMSLTGLRLSLNSALAVIVSVEMLSADQGIGTCVWMAWQTLHMEDLYAALMVIGFFGWSSHWALDLLTRHLLPWQTKENHEPTFK